MGFPTASARVRTNTGSTDRQNNVVWTPGLGNIEVFNRTLWDRNGHCGRVAESMTCMDQADASVFSPPGIQRED